MKKLLKFFSITVVLLFALLLTAPFLFKGKIIALIQTEANKNLVAELYFEDVDISLLRNFPNLAVDIQNLTITGKDTFAGVELFSFESLKLVVDIKTVLSDSPIGIRKVHLKNANAHIITLKNGLFNGDIVKPSDEVVEEELAVESQSAFALELNSYIIENFNLKYDDFEGAIFMNLRNLNHSGSGDFTQDIVALTTTTGIDSLDLFFDGIHLLNHVKAASDFALTYNSLEESLTFGENTVQLNELALEFNGILKFLEDAMDIDLTFAVPSNDFKSVISLIPAYYYQDFEDLVAKGNFDLNGFVKGPYYYENEDYTPAFGFNVLAKNGTISYPDLPEKIENLHIDMSINHPGGDLDLMRVNLPTFALSLAKNPISGHFHVLTPFSDPNIDFGIKTKMDFSSLEKTLKTNDLNIKGLLDADFLFKGRLSHLENEAYDKVTASGGGKLSNFVFESAELDVPIKIAQAEAQLSPQFLNLPMFQMTIGKSDFSASGRLDNLLSYVFSDTTLIGRFQFNSNLIDANELLALMDDETENQAIAENPTETTTGAPSVPANLDFNLNATVEKLLFDVYDITDMKGQLVIANQKLTMNQLLMKTLGGAIEMNGFYETQPEQPPLANFGFDLLNLDLEQVFDKVETLKALAPIGAAAKGLLTTKFNFQSELDGDLSPVLSSIDAAGMFRTANIQYASPTLDKLASSLNNDSYKNLSFKNALVDFEITDGRIFLKPFNIALGSQQAEFSGSHGIDQTMAYKISGKFPAAQLASSAISLPSAERIKDVDLDVLIGGTITSPKISFELKSLGNALRDQVTDIVKDEIGKVVDNAKADAQARAAKLIADAEAKGDQLIAEAQRQANRLRSEAKNAGEKLVKEAQEGAAKLEREAGSNPLKQAAAKRAGDELVRKATAQATALEKEADTNGKRLVQEATNQKEQLVNDAKKKAELENQ